MIQAGYYLPHPPIILAEIGGGEEEKISTTRESFKEVAKEIAELAPDTIILASPHAPLYIDGFYLAGGERVKGDFSRFGFPQLGTVLSLDRELNEKISQRASEQGLPHLLDEDNAGLDHGALVPLSFIEAEYQDFQFVHLGLSGLNASEHKKMGVCIQKAVNDLGRKVVFIASGDCSHVLKEEGPYGYKEAGPAFDSKLMDLLANGDFDQILAISEEEAEEAAECGLRSCQIMAGVLERYELDSQLLSYEGPFGVGYGVASFRVKEELPQDEAQGLGKSILDLAKASISYFLKHNEKMKVPEYLPKELSERKAGCFVTLHKGENLRGCIGTMQSVYGSLADEIIENALSAAFSDPRFDPLKASELEELNFSVDVLGELEQIPSTDLLDPQRYGVYVRSGARSGVLLPRLEGVDTVGHQLGIALAKAGIGATERIELFRFEVIRYE